MDKEMMVQIMDQYEEKQELFEDFAFEIKSLIEDILEVYQIHYHSVPFRVKESKSLYKKIHRSDKNYQSLEDITDIIGIRIITYFAEDVDRIADIICEEFSIDQKHSVDKRAILDPDRFGYLSLHYVCQLNTERLKLIEYRKFKGIKVEIQIRSILQHTWAEIEHDLGYKSKEQIPKELRRSFSRVAGLLEIADLEFAKIRSELHKFEKQFLEQDLYSIIEVDVPSLKQFILNDPLIKELDEHLASQSKKGLQFDDLLVSDLVNQLLKLNLEFIGNVKEKVELWKQEIILMSRSMSLDKLELLPQGICLRYLVLVMHNSQKSKVLIEEPAN